VSQGSTQVDPTRATIAGTALRQQQQQRTAGGSCRCACLAAPPTSCPEWQA
jgi:hypothetical protein